MIKVKPGPVVTKGIDISHHNGVVDFAQVKAAGFAFVFAKCSEYVEDSMFEHNRKEAKAQGLLFGAYHFWHPIKSIQKQVDLFLKYANPQPGDLLPVLDWEVTDSVASIADRQAGLLWLDAVRSAIGGKNPIIYGAPYFLQALGLDQKTFAKYPLWIAHYGVSAPLVPPPWVNWSFWQNSENGSVPGISGGGVDVDLFNGSPEDLKQVCI